MWEGQVDLNESRVTRHGPLLQLETAMIILLVVVHLERSVYLVW
jgi:hypothetical protein